MTEFILILFSFFALGAATQKYKFLLDNTALSKHKRYIKNVGINIMIDFKSLFTDSNDKEVLTAPRNKSTKRIFIAATRMNDGKTTTSLALYSRTVSQHKKNGLH